MNLKYRYEAREANPGEFFNLTERGIGSSTTPTRLRFAMALQAIKKVSVNPRCTVSVYKDGKMEIYDPQKDETKVEMSELVRGEYEDIETANIRKLMGKVVFDQRPSRL